MRRRSWIWILACLLCLVGAWLFWRQPANPRTKPSALPAVAATPAPTVRSASATPNLSATASTNTAASAKTNRFAYRLSNTTKSIDQLMGDRHAILLANAFIDTSVPLNLSIPAHLRSQGDPGAYIVQARGPIDNAFRALLAAAGAQVVAYIPNDAYLVRINQGGASGLASQSLVQAVIPYEPYYKIQSTLLDLATKQEPLPDNPALTLGLFPDTAAQTIQQIEKAGGTRVGQDRSPFGPVVRVQLPPHQSSAWTALATLPGVQIVEPLRQRQPANDLSRVTTGVSSDTLVSTNYMNLTGSNVLVEVNDTGIDANHPDLTTARVFGDSPLSLVDTNGHGTHVAGIIAGSGLESTTVTDAQGSIVQGTLGQFRGKAQLAHLYSVAGIDPTFNFLNNSDAYLQEAPALTNALISNNSWTYGINIYDLAAASYDAAVRDALPTVPGSQPVLFVFAAGNSGAGQNDGTGGNADTILSPATAKNVITVGALEQLRTITNIVTAADGSSNDVWYPETDSADQVAWYSSRGNVGVGTEGGNGRFKPDVIAPGSFVLSTRSEQWNEIAYYNPTNYHVTVVADQVSSGSENFYSLLVPSNAVQVEIIVFPDFITSFQFPDLPIYLWKGTDPRVDPPDLVETNFMFIPPDTTLSPVGAGWQFAVSNNTSVAINYNLLVEIVTTNDNGNYFQVLSNLNQSIGTFNLANSSPGPYYRYESGTSMSAADVSGVLALMQDYFTNTLRVTPSPALLKALLINGARPTGNYSYGFQNTLNIEGWGLISLTNSLPAGITVSNNAAGESMLMIDQSPTNALATGDSHTYLVSITNSDGQFLPMQVTLAWTDPPGDPAAALKLVNGLELVVTNLESGDVYFGNDIDSGNTFNLPWDPTTAPNIDAVNNVQNVFLGPILGTSYSITVLGRSVNVNAVTAQTNNVVQDFALVISVGEGEVTNAFTVADNGIVSNPTGGQQIDYLIDTNSPLLDQYVGASTPLLGTNQVSLGTSSPWGGANGVVTLGMTNQWHFYVITNSGASDYTNAAFITFFPATLSIPRLGVFAGSTANATREADIDLYVAGPNDPNASRLLDLDPMVISNCVNGVDGDSASLSRGGTEFVAYTDSKPGDVYYIGVYSEDQMASEYDFEPIFTDIPFSQPGPNGSQVVNGLNVPIQIPDGSPAHPGIAFVFALALFPMDVQAVIVTNSITHQNFGDLIGTLTHGNGNGTSQSVVLNNHDSLGNTYLFPPFIYDDSGLNDIINSRPSDGPGNLNHFQGEPAIGPWILTMVDDSLTQTGSVTGLTLWIQPHQDLTKGLVTTELGPLGWAYFYIDVPDGATNLSVFATNITGTGTVDLFVRYGAIPTLTNYDEWVQLTNSDPTGLGNSISVGPPLASGRYWVGLYNESTTPQTVQINATLGFGAVPGQVIFSSYGPVPLLDDAVTSDYIFVPTDQTISSMDVALRVDHPRISDLVFHLISPDGTRVLLMENRGALSTNGCGTQIITTNTINLTSTGSSDPNTNIVGVGQISGTLTLTYDFYTVPDQMTVYYGTNIVPANIIFDTGMTDGSAQVNITYGPTNSLVSTYLTIIMNQYTNLAAPGSDLWTYTAGGLQTNYLYLTFTDNTNLTTTPIKFAPPPFVPNTTPGLVWTDSFEAYPVGTNGPGTTTLGGWNVLTNQVLITNAPPAYDGTNLLALMDGVMVTNLPTVIGQKYLLTYALGTAAAEGGGTATNANWQVRSIVFTAAQNVTPLVLSGSSAAWSAFASSLPNAQVLTFDTNTLLDDIQLATVPGDLYYQPEQPLNDNLAGQNAYGWWQLEVQDDRVGATNPAPTLLSWQVRFNFPTSTGSIGSLTNGQLQTSIIPSNSILYYLIYVPTNADIATNTLTPVSPTPTAPLNLLFDQTTPPTGTTPPDYLIIAGTPGGTAILYTNGFPPLLPGQTYYLGVQNTNNFTVTYTIEVDFHLLPTAPTLPALPELLAIVNQPFTVTNAATGGVPPYGYVLTTSVTNGSMPSIDPAAGVITWTPDTNQGPAVYTFTNIVTDGNGLTATDVFHVLVVLTNGLPAFPGAEGAGGFAIGGRGGDVYHVINLNDSGPGSLRYGVQTTFGSRTIVFDVSGTINLFSELRINKPFLTIAGQTAPGAGIAIAGLTTSLENSHDRQVRFLRCRPGDIYSPFFQDDSFHFRGETNSIADHISASWSIDEALSTTISTNITVQWSMIAEPLNHSAHLQDSGAPGFQAHGYGSLLRYGYGAISYHHNLYADNYSRNPRPGDNLRLDFINNVVFNWGIACGYNEDDTANNPGGYTNYLNSIGNYFIAGTNTTANPNVAFASGVPDPTFTQIYQSGNYIDNNPLGSLNGSDTGWSMFNGNYTQLGSPTPMPEIQVTITNAPQAYEQVLAFAGATVAGFSSTGALASTTSLLRDPVDTNIVAGVRNKSGQLIDFISSNSFAGVYLETNFGVTYSGYPGAATYWVSQGYNTFVGANAWPVLDSAPQPLDSDGDGIPDYWEITLAALGTNSMDPAVPNNNHSNPDGYTDLEHYLNWLAAPHALTVSNTPVDVDLYAIVGRTGNLSFGVTNATNGTVTLGTDGHTATFSPTNTFFGFASFDFSVTNLATTNGFDVTVSVMVSATNIVTSSTVLTNAVAQTNTVPTNSIVYYLVTVPVNAQWATNILFDVSGGPLNLLFSQVGLPTGTNGTNTGDYTLLANSMGGSSLLSTNTTPTNIVPGGTYYLAVQNSNNVPVTFSIEVDFYPPPSPPPPLSTNITIVSITPTNGGFLLQWQGPTNDQYQIQWTTNLAPIVWSTVPNPVINVFLTPTNGHYSWFDDGTLTGGLGPMKFYRILGSANLGPITGPSPATNVVLAGTISQAVVPVPANALSASNFLIFATGPLNVWLNPTNPPVGSTIAGDFLMLSTATNGTFVLTSTSVPPLVPGTNYYLGFQNPGTSNVTFSFQVEFGFAPVVAASNFMVTATNGGIWLKWNGLTNYQYQVQWTTNLVSPIAWNTVSNIVLTSTTGIFTWFDDGSLTGGFGPMKFYRLIAYPYLTPIPQTLTISSVTVTSAGGTNNLALRWTAPTNYQYGIQWTTNLALPFSNWATIASPVLTLTNGVYTFTDNGQTGPPASTKFFRLLEY